MAHQHMRRLPSGRAARICFDYFKELQIEIPQAVDDPVQSALSSLGRTYVAKSARNFEVKMLFQFWATEFASNEWLLYKAISLVGFFGLARNKELVNLTWNDVDVDDRGVWILIKRCKCEASEALHKVLIPNISGHRVIPSELFLRYRDSVRTACPTATRLWLPWRRNKWHTQPMGKTTIAAVSRKIAEHLFPGQDNTGFRGHSWRPSGATALANYGGSVLQLQTAGNWKSVKVATDYVRESTVARLAIAETMCGDASQPLEDDAPAPQASATPTQVVEHPSKIQKIMITSPSHCTINIHL